MKSVDPNANPTSGARVLRRRLAGDALQEYYLYVPTTLRPLGDTLVAVHGISRNARDQAWALRSVAERFGMPLVAPLFDEVQGRGYQQLRCAEGRADLTLERIVADVEQLLQRPSGALWIWGYSAGAQFAHRFALNHPHRVAGLALGAAGWYTFPDAQRRFPEGLRASRHHPHFNPDLHGFLQLPVTVLVGSRDIVADNALRCTPGLVRRQGAHRLERARRWVAALRKAAASQGSETLATLQVLPGIAHDFDAAVDAGLASRLIQWIDAVSRAAAPARLDAHRPRRVAHVALALVLAVLFSTGAPAVRAGTVQFDADDGLSWRGDGWTANLGLTLAADSGDASGDDPDGNGSVLRRARPSLSLSLSPRWSARVEYEFGDIGPGFKNAWLQWRPSSRLHVRLGSQFAPFGLENSTSSASMPWLERSLASALTPAALTGLSARLQDDRWTLAAGVYGNDIGDDDRRRYAGQSAIVRGTWVPVRGDGWLWHLGASAEYRRGESDAALRLRSRPEAVITDTRLVDTGTLSGVDSLGNIGLETALRRGPVLVQAEYLHSAAKRAPLQGGDASFGGGYVTASWFITGERRNYSEASGAFGGVRPKRDWGALELALRASQLDLDDGAVTGGREDNLSATLNWYVLDLGRVSLAWIRADAERAGLPVRADYLALRAQIAF